MMNERLSAWMRSGMFFQYQGRRVFVRRGGSGPSLLLIHGYPTSSFDWHAVWDELTQHYRVIAPDMLGMGFSDKPIDATYNLAEHADLHEAVLDRLGIPATFVLAHDQGVSVAQEMLARRTGAHALATIEAVALLNGGLFPEMYRPRIIQHLLSSPLGSWIGPRVPRGAFERSVRSLFGPHTPPSAQLLQEFWELLNFNEGRKVTHRVGRFYIERLRLRERLTRPLLQQTTPVRLINGSQDPNSGRHMAQRYQSLVPGADIVSLETIGHWPQIEAPQAVVEAVHTFFNTRRCALRNTL